MIIRIMGEGQFELPSSYYDELNSIDNRIVEKVSRGDKVGFREEFDRILELVRENGKPLDQAIIVESDLIVPPAEITLEEARQIFTGQGLLKD